MPLVSSFSVGGSGTGDVKFGNHAGTTTAPGTTTSGTTTSGTTAALAAAAATAAASLAGGIASVQAVALGVGSNVYAGNSGTTHAPILNFKSLRAGSHIALTEDANTITISVTGGAGGGGGATAFTQLADAPPSITDNGLLYGFGGALHFAPAPSGANQALVWTGSAFTYATLHLGTVTSVGLAGSADFSITPTPVTASGTLSIALAPTGVSPGTYAVVSVDANGRVLTGHALLSSNITTALGYTPGRVQTINGQSPDGNGNVVVATTGGVRTINGQSPDGNGNILISTSGIGTVTSVAAASGTGIAVSGGPITSSGTLTIGLAASGVTSGVYGNLTLDPYGRVTAARALNSSDIVTGLNYVPVKSVNGTMPDGAGAVTIAVGSGTVTSVAAASGTGITVSGGPITTSGTLTIGLAASGVSAGTYGFMAFDSFGRATFARALSAGDVSTALGYTPGQVTSVALGAGAGIAVSGSPITSSGSITVALTTTSVTAGSYGPFSVDGYGRLTRARMLTSSDVTTALGYAPSQVQTVNGVGPDGTGNVQISVSGSGGTGTVTTVATANGTGILVTGGPITSAGTLTIGLATSGVVAGSYTHFAVDGTGRLTYARALSNGDVTGALGFTPVNTTALGAASGVATLDGSGKLTSSQLPASVVGAVVYQGTWNAASNTPAFASGVGTKGFYYKVATAGTTTIDGISQWNVGDTIIFNGTTWDKIDGIANEVLSVNGLTGAVSITSVTGNAGTATKLATARQIALTSDVTGSANFDGSSDISITATLPATGVAAGSYTTFVVDAKGRLTSARTLSSTDISNALGYVPASSAGGGNGTLTSVSAVGNNGVTVAGSPITTAGTLSIGLATTGVTAGTYALATVVVDPYGRVTSISQGAAGSNNGPTEYAFSVSFDGSGNINATNPFGNVPAGWTISRDSTTQFTVTHNLAKAPQHIAFYGDNGTYLTLKTPTGNPTSQFSMTTPSAAGATPNTFTIFGLNSTAVAAAVNLSAYVRVLI